MAVRNPWLGSDSTNAMSRRITPGSSGRFTCSQNLDSSSAFAGPAGSAASAGAAIAASAPLARSRRVAVNGPEEEDSEASEAPAAADTESFAARRVVLLRRVAGAEDAEGPWRTLWPWKDERRTAQGAAAAAREVIAAADIVVEVGAALLGEAGNARDSTLGRGQGMRAG